MHLICQTLPRVSLMSLAKLFERSSSSKPPKRKNTKRSNLTHVHRQTLHLSLSEKGLFAELSGLMSFPILLQLEELSIETCRWMYDIFLCSLIT